MNELGSLFLTQDVTLNFEGILLANSYTHWTIWIVSVVLFSLSLHSSRRFLAKVTKRDGILQTLAIVVLVYIGLVSFLYALVLLAEALLYLILLGHYIVIAYGVFVVVILVALIILRDRKT